MATMQRWDPFRDLLSLQNEMTRLFNRATGETGSSGDLLGGTWVPPMDVLETQDHYTVTLELPGLTPDQVDITFNDGALVVRGERKFYDGQSEENYHRVERRYGAFARSLMLPAQVDAEKISATFANGVLTLEIPKAEVAKPRRIEVRTS